MPIGVGTILFVYEGSFKTSSGEMFQEGDVVIAGQMDQPSKYLLTEDFGFFAACLQPYVLPILLTLPGAALLNKIFTASGYIHFMELTLRLARTKSNEERAKVMESELGKINRSVEQSDPDFCFLVKEMNQLNLLDLTQAITKAGLSTRQFQRKFKALTGYTPIHYLRIARMQTILDQANPQDLTRLALQFGYYDQSHFINDFKKITGGITPRKYFDGIEGLQWKSLGECVAIFQS